MSTVQNPQTVEPSEQEVRDLAAEHNLTIPNQPRFSLVRRSRFDDLSDDLVAALVALAKAEGAARYWKGRFDEECSRVTAAELSATAARAAYDTANERAGQFEAERDKLRAQLERHQDEPDPQAPVGTAFCTYSAAETAQHLEAGCESCAATLPDQPRDFLIKVAHEARDSRAAVALLLILLDVDRRNTLEAKATQ
uniref:hypothetical protein n=1 Tax=Streptomyces anulatus TaxID=1892 RepID=UPI002F925C57|nr:hypothetical protein OH765_40010 [Streptomyces anulatus]